MRLLGPDRGKLKEEKDRNVIATANGIQPNQLRNCKKREENLKEIISEERKKKETREGSGAN